MLWSENVLKPGLKIVLLTYTIGYTYKFFIYKFQLVLPWCTTLGSEVKVQLKTILTQHDLKPQAVTCQLCTLKLSILSNPFQFILHLSENCKEGTKESWVGNLWYKPLVSFHCTVGSNLAKNCGGLKNFTKKSNSTRVKYVKKQYCIKTESISKQGNFNSVDKSLVPQ